MKAYGQKFVKFCTLTHTHTHAAKLVVEMICLYISNWRWYADTNGFALNHPRTLHLHGRGHPRIRNIFSNLATTLFDSFNLLR